MAWLGAGISYTVVGGASSDEWHTTTTVLDAESDKLISKTEFQNPDMYKV